mmetsp:Transcript_14595/g.20414  ORF Transcript_14595/g.20414 Transcript_14595/m.20414 type:complete len:182 (+) Transcript_14595:151-696(+)|eukprot:CAMPEP_0184483576 /NCGR_PEP_ID=MMETSP0113_2-20130426/5241_1 /TAXON_ID=91329 /ORGANISM="Norrisiella sphaerica, Strain BC52" /LENGTH=181 /DNA_ID=CAMNT_0026864081 /DNA_START=403 /DNA_END=948 /DNA_ORIENTATION=+
MGNDQSSPEARYKRELLKLSWNLVLTVQEQAKSQQEALEEASRNSAESKDSKMSSVFNAGQNCIRPFHVDFMEQFLKYCPDLKTKFPSNYTLVSKMIQTFISNAIKTTDVNKLGRSFAKGHLKYKLTDEHFQGFAMALVDVIQSRLGKFGTIELIKIWRKTTEGIIGAMQKEYLKAQRVRR